MLPLVVGGGVIGVAVREALLLPFAGQAGDGGLSLGALLATIGINTVGAGVLGLVVGGLAGGRPLLRAFLGTGVIGGFTTYSGFAVLLAEPLREGLGLAAAALAAGALIAAAACATLGLRAGADIARRRGAP
ncbi:hypothetical protein GCM10022202_20660 [Microbacterium marinilacus]|uniref:Fluoride-specific ion channel n=2 Tax=Microbacterium marinilacus TaxID=415209 RepID=A0ABP7BG22_9MICO